ncbi:MAG TPA: hypothetical protein VNB46_00495 [Gaiellaceae bacterium]|jgi:hypothetical protein|nr:hypothetical protein [Gaiellaceae bacterium]
MGIGSWWKKFRAREDEAAIERAQERVHETVDERRIASGDLQGLEADEMAARTMHEPKIEDAERFAEDDDRR